MDKLILSILIARGHSLTEIASLTGVTKSAVRHALSKYELKTKRKPGQRHHDVPKNCMVCGKIDTPRWLCQSCYTKVRRYRQKQKAVNLLGGKCAKCGWAGNLAGFSFHHIDRNTKDFQLASVANKSWSVIKKELDKCILLCATCHCIEHSSNESESFLKAVEKYKGLTVDN